MIKVVGLGFNKDSVTKRGLNVIMESDMVIMRTLRTPSAKSLEGIYHGSFDFLYDKAESFDELNDMIVDELMRLNENFPNLVYCVDGDGYKDSSVVELAKRTRVEIIPGPFDLAFAPSTSCIYMSAYDLVDNIYPDPIMPICVYNIDDANIAGDVKLFLLRFYAPETKVLISNAGISTTIVLEELDRQRKYNYDTAVYVEGGFNASFADLLRVMTRLTAPNGCPWDKAQTHESIRINLLEEAYETVDAITNDNLDGMIEELGDVMLQVVFHCDIALRQGEFTLEDVIKGLNDKLIGRHTHIFGSDKADGADGALNVWERNKMKEKHQDTFSSAVNDIPKCFPALLRAQKAVKRVEKGGWGGKTPFELRETLIRDIDLLLKAHASGDQNSTAKMLGSVLLCVAQIGHAVGGNCEQALLDAVVEVQRHYTAFETAVLNDGKDVNKLSKEEWQKYYNEAQKID